MKHIESFWHVFLGQPYEFKCQGYYHFKVQRFLKIQDYVELRVWPLEDDSVLSQRRQMEHMNLSSRRYRHVGIHHRPFIT